MIKVKLSKEERDQLKQARKTRNSNLSERCLYVLLSDEGKSPPEIAKHTKHQEQIIRYWLVAYQKKGIEGLKGTKPPGRPNKKSKKIYPIILEIIPKSPTDYDYIEEGWTINLVVDYLKKEGIDVSPSTVKRVLRKNGWIYKRFSKTIPSHAPTDPEKRTRINQIVEEIKKDQQDKDVEIFFVDESHFSNEPYVQRGWFLVGEKKKVATPTKKESQTIIGALNLKNKKFYWKQANKGNSKTFIQFGHQLRQSFPKQLIVLILDNSSIHKSKLVRGRRGDVDKKHKKQLT